MAHGKAIRHVQFLALLLMISSCSSFNKNSLNSEVVSKNQTAKRAIANVNSPALKTILDLVAEIRTHLPELGSPRAHLLTDFSDAAKRAMLEATSESKAHARIKSLYAAYKIIEQDRDYAFFTGRESPSVEKLLSELDRKVQALPGDFSYLESAKISYLRIQSNRINRALRSLSEDNLQNSTQAELNRIIETRNAFASVPGHIAPLSTVTTREVLQMRIQRIMADPGYQKLLRLVKTSYFKLRESSEIEGSALEMDNVTSLTIGTRVLDRLFREILSERAPAADSPFELILEDMVEVLALDTMETPKLQKINRLPAAANASELTLIGRIPGHYLGQDKNSFVLGYVSMKARVITELKAIKESEINALVKAKANVLLLKSDGKDFDAIYPGIIDLHNHTKQNNLPVWGQAKGQFENRFEWRDWGDYTKSVSQNMNPWVQFGKPVECAAFRWSELQAMVVGTTYLQGPSTCVDSFGILRVEDKNSYLSKKLAVQAPTDIIIPNDFQFVWSALRPTILLGSSYEAALAAVVGQYCPSLAAQITEKSVSEPAGLKLLSDQALLQKSCPDTTEKPLPPKFIRYVYWIHSGMVGKKKYLMDPKRAAVVGHLAEGRRSDPYNMKEYEILKLLGLNLPHMNFVHGVGIESSNFRELAAKKMGLIWSPFSNLILYGETLDIEAAHKAGVVMAIGSDWLPTGSKGSLEEIKLAAQYVDKMRLNKVFSDEVLYKMLNENPAKLINHWEEAGVNGAEHSVGQIKVGAMATLIVTTVLDPNPFSNLVRKVYERDLNLTVIDGQVVYGNTDYLAQLNAEFETLSDLDAAIDDKQVFNAPVLANPKDKSGVAAHLLAVAQSARAVKFAKGSGCNFTKAKGFVLQNSGDSSVRSFETASGLNLDRFEDIQRLLAVNVMTQSLNRTSKTDGDIKYATPYFPSLYSCNDSYHQGRLAKQVQAKGGDDMDANRAARVLNRKGFGKGPEGLSRLYQ